MILGLIYLVAEWSVSGTAVLIPIGIATVVGLIEQRRVRKVTVLDAPPAMSSGASTIETRMQVWTTTPGVVDLSLPSVSASTPAKNGLVEPCARHDSNMRPLPPQGSALSPELRALADATV